MNVTDVNDNSPVFYPSRYYAVVPKSAGVGYSVLSVIATDADKGDNGVIRYSLAQNSGAGGLFTVDAETGELAVSSALPSTSTTYTIQVN